MQICDNGIIWLKYWSR